jgi:hypothetical protein
MERTVVPIRLYQHRGDERQNNGEIRLSVIRTLDGSFIAIPSTPNGPLLARPCAVFFLQFI